MRRMICLLIAIVLLVTMVVPVQAARLDDMQARYKELLNQQKAIRDELLRIEGAFAERRAIEAEVAEGAVIEPDDLVTTGTTID